MTPIPKLRCGTRRSPLALAQAHQFVRALTDHYGWPEGAVEVIGLSTRGDEILNQPLADIGGKGLFTESLEKALREGTIDFAVHSLKDLPTHMPEDLMLACIPAREDPQDVLLWRKMGDEPDQEPAQKLTELAAQTALIGTASLRRGAQLRYAYPAMRIMPLRGNIGTRLDKLSPHDGAPQATLLAIAGMKRLALADDNFAATLKNEIHHLPLPIELMLPAPAQGALGIQCLSDNAPLKDMLAPLHCVPTTLCVTAERGFLRALAGDCRTPVAALAQIKNNELCLTTRLLSVDGAACHEVALTAKKESEQEAEHLGTQTARHYMRDAPELVPKEI